MTSRPFSGHIESSITLHRTGVVTPAVGDIVGLLVREVLVVAPVRERLRGAWHQAGSGSIVPEATPSVPVPRQIMGMLVATVVMTVAGVVVALVVSVITRSRVGALTGRLRADSAPGLAGVVATGTQGTHLYPIVPSHQVEFPPSWHGIPKVLQEVPRIMRHGRHRPLRESPQNVVRRPARPSASGRPAPQHKPYPHRECVLKISIIRVTVNYLPGI